MSKGTLTTATTEHVCSNKGCPVTDKKIQVGDSIVKTPPTGMSVEPHYYHANTCWPVGRGKK
jgi:thiamine monophosphate kinase